MTEKFILTAAGSSTAGVSILEMFRAMTPDQREKFIDTITEGICIRCWGDAGCPSWGRWQRLPHDSQARGLIVIPALAPVFWYTVSRTYSPLTRK